MNTNKQAAALKEMEDGKETKRLDGLRTAVERAIKDIFVGLEAAGFSHERLQHDTTLEMRESLGLMLVARARMDLGAAVLESWSDISLERDCRCGLSTSFQDIPISGKAN